MKKNQNLIIICLVTFLSGSLMMLFFFGKSHGQTSYKPLSVGDKAPDYTIKNILNHPEGEVKISALKDELVILDFMSLICSPCIKSLVYMDSLQQKLPGFKVLPITPESGEKVKKILQRKKWFIPFAVEKDKTLDEIFPYSIISHLVWIKDGKIIAITDSKQATAENIRAVLRGEEVNLPVKKDQVDFDATKPLLVDGNGGGGEALLYQSAFSRFIPEIPGGISRSEKSLSYRNASALALYKHVFGDASQNNYQFQFDNRIIFETGDSLKRLLINEKGLPSNKFCYTLYFSRSTPRSKMLNIAKQDINNFFSNYYGISGEIETRKRKCLVLFRTTTQDLIKSGQNIHDVTKNVKPTLSFQNKPFKLLLTDLYSHLRDNPMPVVDATGYKGRIDIDLYGDLKNIQNLNEELGRYGLTLSEKECEVDMLIISEVEN